MASRITCLSSMATRHLLADLTPEAERRTGCTIEVRSVGGVEAARMVRAGEAFDLVVLASGALAALEGEGWIVPGSRMVLFCSGIAAAVPAGYAHPPFGDAEAVGRAMRAARRVGFSTGPSGTYVAGLAARWDVAERLVQAPPGVPVGALLAEGAVDLGFQQWSELLGLPGIEIVGPLPADVQSVTVFAGGIGPDSAAPEQARAVMGALRAPEAEETIRRNGMEPAAGS